MDTKDFVFDQDKSHRSTDSTTSAAGSMALLQYGGTVPMCLTISHWVL